MTLPNIIQLFTTPSNIHKLSLENWQTLIRVLRGNDLLASFYYLLDRELLLNHVPHFALKHLESAEIYAKRQTQQIHLESESLVQFLGNADIQPIFLKGAAYVLRKDINHYGRVMSDIDILVPYSQLSLIENILKQNDWVEKTLDDYDEQYYRQWAHELPPYQHIYRGTTLDIHHTLLPPISGKLIPENELLSNLQTTNDGYLTLSPELIILHSVIHLFYNEDFTKSFRDVWDIHLLLMELEKHSDLTSLIKLSERLGFSDTLYIALKLRDKIFSTSSLGNYHRAQSSLHLLNYRYSKWTDLFINNVIYFAILPSHDLVDSYWSRCSRFIMFIRGHVLKMPLKILLPHLARKSYRYLVTLLLGRYHYEK
ncbi:nucleotidyltransferase family protein [Alteromonadaceae bacterium BrNp21-10]|nr:nucleotidyltransferase family protein [Alteromonadaceae bacterium BrNp21-10]